MPKDSIKTDTDWKSSKNVTFTQFTDEHFFTLVEDAGENRKIECRDISTGELAWVYPKEDNPNYNTITKTLVLKDVSSRFEKMIVQYNSVGSQEYEHEDKKRFLCLDVSTQEIVWELDSFEFVSVLGDSDKFLIRVSWEKDSDKDYGGCRNFECRKLSTNEIVWKDCFEVTSYFGYADENYAYFPHVFCGDAPGATKIDVNTPKQFHEYEPRGSEFSLNLAFPKASDDVDQVIDKWPENAKNAFLKSIGEIDKYYLTNNGFVVLLYILQGEDCQELSGFKLLDSENGEVFSSLYGPSSGDIDLGRGFRDDYEPFFGKNSSTYNLEHEILEMGGYFFKLPEKEYIDLPNTYHLQHYSETTGKYYFLDMDGGQVVCVSLEG
ncbi:MAG: hypothetical protein R2883_03460 [Caldisericia bacterium]